AGGAWASRTVIRRHCNLLTLRRKERSVSARECDGRRAKRIRRYPNGLCFSPDEKKLYLVDREFRNTPATRVRFASMTLMDGIRLKNSRLFVNVSPGSSDGIRCDVDGNVWSAAGWAGMATTGGHVFAPDGALMGKIHLPEVCANLCFGGAKKNRLFMAASQSLYALYVGTEGAQLP